MTLALEGGKPAISGQFRKFSTIAEEEINAVAATMRAGPLSGYLGGELHGGLRCEALEYEFAGALGVKHAIACNSATSGLLMACNAVGVGHGSTVVTTPYTMSATAAAPAFLGADVLFGDIEAKTFNLGELLTHRASAVVIANIFGHPARLQDWRKICDMYQIPLIEDNAQSPFAMEGKHYAGTVGDIGIFSFNIHKHLQCGEGGICTTNSDELADAMRLYRNHGELAGMSVGLNLRMTETTAAIALAQLAKRDRIIASRIELADELTHMVVNVPGVRPPIVREGCTHVYYLWSLLLDHDRNWFVRACQAEGIPLRAGYVTPLYMLKAFMQDAHCPVVEDIERRIALFEICAWDPSRAHMRQMREAFKKVGEEYAKKQVQGEAESLADVDAAR